MEKITYFVQAENEIESFTTARKYFTRNYLLHLMKLTKGNVSKASRLSGKYRADLYGLLTHHNINPKDYRK